MVILFVGALASCVMIGPDGLPMNRAPLPLSAVAGTYEGTNIFFIHRLELYPDGTGLWAVHELSDSGDPEIEIGLITSWKTTVNEGIEIRYRDESDAEAGGVAEELKGQFFAGILHIRTSDTDETWQEVMHLVREPQMDKSRKLLKQTIMNLKDKTQQTISSD